MNSHDRLTISNKFEIVEWDFVSHFSRYIIYYIYNFKILRIKLIL